MDLEMKFLGLKWRAKRKRSFGMEMRCSFGDVYLVGKRKKVWSENVLNLKISLEKKIINMDLIFFHLETICNFKKKKNLIWT